MPVVGVNMATRMEAGSCRTLFVASDTTEESPDDSDLSSMVASGAETAPACRLQHLFIGVNLVQLILVAADVAVYMHGGDLMQGELFVAAKYGTVGACLMLNVVILMRCTAAAPLHYMVLLKVAGALVFLAIGVTTAQWWRNLQDHLASDGHRMKFNTFEQIELASFYHGLSGLLAILNFVLHLAEAVIRLHWTET